MTQIETIEHHLKYYGSITTLESALDYGITCLSERVRDLREKGVKVKTTMEKKNGKHFARYSL